MMPHTKSYPHKDITTPTSNADIEGAHVIPFDELLPIVFGLPDELQEVPLEISAVSTSSELRTLITNYTTIRSKEELRFEAFTTIANCILTELGNHSSSTSEAGQIVFRLNDSICIEDFSSQRKPGCVVVHQRVVDSDPKEQPEESSKEPAFHWSDILAVVEFKVEVSMAAVSAVRRRIQPARKRGRSQRKTGSRSGTLRPSSNFTSVADSTSFVGTSTPSYVTYASDSTGSTLNDVCGSQQSGFLKHTLELEKGSEKPSKKCKTDATDTPPMPKSSMIQCASYALEMMCFGGFRTHALGILITDHKLELQCYDRSLTTRSSPIDFIDQPSKLVELLYRMQHATSKNWGIVSAITRGPDSLANIKDHNDHLRGTLLKLNNGVVLKLGDVLFVHHALISRGTCVVKFSFTPKTRAPEGEILAGVVKIAKKCKDHEWVLNHLPEILHRETSPSTVTDVQALLSKYSETQPDIYEYRVLHVLIMTEQHPITRVTTAKELITAFKGVLKCYRWLYETAQVMHRDISLNNVMFCQKDGQIFGILNDYDLVLQLKNRGFGSSSKQRTGTRPFMAIDLLEIPPMAHRYRHDLESLFYVLLFVATGYDADVAKADLPLLGWYKAKREDLYNAKWAILSVPKLPPFAPQFIPIGDLVLGVMVLFRAGYWARSSHTYMLKTVEQDTAYESVFDEETLGGHVDFDKFEKALSVAF